jgi:hypothetical protein
MPQLIQSSPRECEANGSSLVFAGAFIGGSDQICGSEANPTGMYTVFWCGYAQTNAIHNEGGGRYVGLHMSAGAPAIYLNINEIEIYQPGALGR